MRQKISAYIEERNTALFSLDRPTIEKFMKRHGNSIPDNDIVFWAGVYKCICNIKNAPPHLIEKGKTWLHAHGMSEKIVLSAYYN